MMGYLVKPFSLLLTEKGFCFLPSTGCPLGGKKKKKIK